MEASLPLRDDIDGIVRGIDEKCPLAVKPVGPCIHLRGLGKSACRVRTRRDRSLCGLGASKHHPRQDDDKDRRAHLILLFPPPVIQSGWCLPRLQNQNTALISPSQYVWPDFSKKKERLND
jgi:hypothetical protein